MELPHFKRFTCYLLFKFQVESNVRISKVKYFITKYSVTCSICNHLYSVGRAQEFIHGVVSLVST